MSEVIVNIGGERFAFPDQASADRFKAAAAPGADRFSRNVERRMSGGERVEEGFESADRRSGADFMTRLGASFKMTEEGKIAYLRHRYGPENVFKSPSGEIYFKEKGGKLTLFDERGLTLSDLADFGGDSPGVILSALGALSGTGGGPVGAAGGAMAGAAAGNALRQNVSNLLPGSDQMTPGQRVGSMATDAAIAGATQFGADKLVPMADLARPTNLAAHVARAAVAKPDARAVAQASSDTGIPLTMAEETGSQVLRRTEDFARRVPFVADRFRQFDEGQAKAAVAKIGRIMDDLIPEAQTDVLAGQRMQAAFDNTMDGLISMRRAQADRDFGLVGRLSKGEPVLSPRNLRGEIRALITEFDVPGAGDASAALVTKAKSLLEQIKQPAVGERAPSLTADHVNRLLQIYSKASAGKGSIFENLDRAQQRMIGARLHGALERDLDDAITAATEIATDRTGEVARAYRIDPTKPAELQRAGQIAEALKKARENYKIASAPIEEVRQSVIGKYLGTETPRTPERVADALVKMKPTEMQAAFRLLGAADPELREGTARLFLERALGESAYSPTQFGGGTVNFSAAKFLKALPEKEMLSTLVGGTPAAGQIANVVKVLERVATKPAEGSQTAGRLITWSMMGGGGAALLLAEPVSTALGIGATYITANKIANAMLTPQGRQALTTLATTSEPTKKAIAAASYLVGQQAVGSGVQQ